MALMVKAGRFVNTTKDQSKSQFDQMGRQVIADLGNMRTVGSGLLTPAQHRELQRAEETVRQLLVQIRSQEHTG